MRTSTEIMIVCLLGSILSWMTPWTWLVDVYVVGGVMMVAAQFDRPKQ
jgi:hypothetical protein